MPEGFEFSMTIDSEEHTETSTEQLTGQSIEKLIERQKPNLKIAIVGAPNVGKSTLFNKLLGGRRSIVEDLPGVTRDRIYADVNLARWSYKHNNLQVTLIDTGGLFFEADTLYQGVQSQVQLAIDEADCILFVTDSRLGITPTDRQIVKLLRAKDRTAKPRGVEKQPVILLVNKIDSEHQEDLLTEFYSLGFGDPLPFSSLGSNFGQSIERLLEKLDELALLDNLDSKHMPAEEQIKIALMGKPNVGKSSLLNKMVGYERSLVHDQPGTTRDALDTELLFEDKEILLIDTAGLRRKSKVYGGIERFSIDRSIKAMVRADIAALVIDASEGVTHQEQKLASLIQKRNKGCVIILNKWDLIDKSDKTFKEYSEQVRKDLYFVDYAPLVITSAHSGQRVEDILKQCIMVHQNMQKRISTGVLNSVLREIVALNEPAKAGAKKLKIYYGTQVEINPPTFAIFVNDPDNFHENYLRYLERQVRKEFGFAGAPLKWLIKKSEGKIRK
jgi:GTP-binding protein